jgi:ABC-type antimicrobial peptide transport system permease subunit
VAVTFAFERRPEIGLRQSVSATRRAIATQFLLGAVAMSGAGGMVGLVCVSGVYPARPAALDSIEGVRYE